MRTFKIWKKKFELKLSIRSKLNLSMKTLFHRIIETIDNFEVEWRGWLSSWSELKADWEKIVELADWTELAIRGVIRD